MVDIDTCMRSMHIILFIYIYIYIYIYWYILVYIGESCLFRLYGVGSSRVESAYGSGL